MLDLYSNFSYESLFLKISLFLNTNLRIFIHNIDKTYYLIQASNRISLKIILVYFSEHSLFSSKHLDYLNWKETAQYLLSNTAYSSENRIKILELKKVWIVYVNILIEII
jgi:hypothetical protein